MRGGDSSPHRAGEPSKSSLPATPHSLKTDVSDLAEPFFDAATEKLGRSLFKEGLPELAKDLPLLKYVKSGSDLIGSYRKQKFRKIMSAFLKSLISDEYDITDFEKLSQEEKNEVLDILITELDNQSNDLQSEAFGLLVNAYLKKEMDRLTFLGISHELKNTNPLAFYFNVDGLIVRKEGEIWKVSGPTNHLPVAFGHNTVSGIGSWDSAGDYYFVLSNLGKAFFEKVYAPMSERYLM